MNTRRPWKDTSSPKWRL